MHHSAQSIRTLRDMYSSPIKPLLTVLLSILIIHAFSSQATAVVNRRTDISSHAPDQQRGLEVATTSVLHTTHHVQTITARQYQHSTILVNGWFIHFNPPSPFGHFMPLQVAAAVMTDMWTHVLSEARNWRNLPELGRFVITYGDYLRVCFEPLGTTATGAQGTMPWWLVVELANRLRNLTQRGGLGHSDMLLTQGNVAVFVRVELLGLGDH